LMRHALSSSSSSSSLSLSAAATSTRQQQLQQQPLVFWIHELIHLAETQGVFTLVVSCGSNNNNTTAKHTSTTPTTTTTLSLWIRLWQWDSFQASSSEQQQPASSGNNNGARHEYCYLPLNWYRVAKVVYQVGSSRQEFVPSSSSSSFTLPLAWTGDWCCPPLPPPPQEQQQEQNSGIGTNDDPTTTAATSSSSRIVVATFQEWEYKCLEGALEHGCNLLKDHDNDNDNNAAEDKTKVAVAKTTYWAQTGQTLTEERLSTRMAGVAHVPLL
jgi:hypothetical protein